MNDDDWDFFNKSVGKLEKEVITLKKENEKLKENIHSMLFTDDVVQDRYDKLKEENTKLKTENKWYSEQLNEAMKEVDKRKEQNKSISGLMDSMSQTNKALASRLEKLKELLKRAKEVLEDEGDYMIVQEISQVLGDKTDENK
jgi:chromosome segregation ATPase